MSNKDLNPQVVAPNRADMETGKRYFIRLNLSERLQHFILFACFIVLEKTAGKYSLSCRNYCNIFYILDIQFTAGPLSAGNPAVYESFCRISAAGNRGALCRTTKYGAEIRLGSICKTFSPCSSFIGNRF